MLPFLCLAILCGLLTQNAEGNGNPVAIANLSPQMLQQLISNRINPQELKNHLRSLPLEDVIKKGIKQGNGQGGLLSGIPLVGGLLHNVLGNLLEVKMKNMELLKLDIKLAEDENRLIVTIPADMEIDVRGPLHLLDRIIHMKLYLDIQVGVRILRDPATGHLKLTIENCQNNPGHLRLTLLENLGHLLHIVNSIVRLITDVVEKAVPHLLQKQLCPPVNALLQQILDLIQGPSYSDERGEKVWFLAESSYLHDGILSLAYQGKMQLPGGQNVVIPPNAAQLPAVPLGESPMNMVLGGSYLSFAIRAVLHPQTVTVDVASHSQGAVFRQEAAAWVQQASNIRALQIAAGESSLSLTVGKIQVCQPIEIRAYTGQAAHSPLFVIRVNVCFTATPSTAGEKLILTLHSPRIDNLFLVSSSVGNFDVRHLTGTIGRLLSTTLLPRQNAMLAQGIPLPLMSNLGFKSLSFAVGEGALLGFVPPSVEA